MYNIVNIKEIVEYSSNLKTFIFDKAVGNPNPGQFAMVFIPGLNEKPFSYSGKKEMIIEKRGPFTEELFKKQEGDILHIRGPKGNGFRKHRDATGIAGGCGIGPLLFDIKEQRTNKLFYGARSVDSLIQDPALGNVEVAYATDDGTMGYRGFVTDLVEDNIDSMRHVKICGPEIMMKKTFDLLKQSNTKSNVRDFTEFSIERYMKCGAGICGECSISGYLTCSDGPVFSYQQLLDMPDFGSHRRIKSGAKVKI